MKAEKEAKMCIMGGRMGKGLTTPKCKMYRYALARQTYNFSGWGSRWWRWWSFLFISGDWHLFRYSPFVCKFAASLGHNQMCGTCKKFKYTVLSVLYYAVVRFARPIFSRLRNGDETPFIVTKHRKHLTVKKTNIFNNKCNLHHFNDDSSDMMF